MLFLFSLAALLFAAGSSANAAAGKWQLLFFYNTYRYQVDAFGVSGSQMAPGCTQVCTFQQFVKEVCRTSQVPVKNGKQVVKGPDGRPFFEQKPPLDKIDFNAIGDGDTFNQAKFISEFDNAGFAGSVKNEKIFVNWNNKDDNFVKVMDRASQVAVDASNKLQADKKPTANARYTALQKALEIHANARRFDQAGKVVQAFIDDANKKGYQYFLSADEISRPPAPAYRHIDVQRTISENGLTGKKADDIRSFVSNFNMAGQSKTHVEAISKAQVIQDNLAAACGARS